MVFGEIEISRKKTKFKKRVPAICWEGPEEDIGIEIRIVCGEMKDEIVLR